ncbi:MAG: ACP S-malonyltransferase [Candidatus Cloacimonadota bacterium]|nr:ACP S-malonyltransferase [Candidatus Cloacimonadota bacterium]
MSFKGKKVAFVFPGQGAQYIEMGMDFIENNPKLKESLIQFDKKNNTELYKIMREGPEEKLRETRYTQPAILLHSIAAMNSLKEKLDIEPDFVAGHSLGEFSALVANGVLSLEDAMYLVHRRGQFMIDANEEKEFAMAAILGLKADKVIEICEEASKIDIVIAANFNTPKQIVISGSKAGVDKACELAKENKARRIMPLVVGGPFHSPLINRAENWLAEELKKINFVKTQIPVVANVDALPTTDLEKIKDNLAKQVTSSVLWVDSVKKMIADGVEIFIEFGPKNVVSGMIKKINKKQTKRFNLDNLEDLDKLIEGLKKI